MNRNNQGEQHEQGGHEDEKQFGPPDSIPLRRLGQGHGKCAEANFLPERGQTQQHQSKAENPKDCLVPGPCEAVFRNDPRRQDGQKEGDAKKREKQPDFFANERGHVTNSAWVLAME
jgi:hypothetical protein